MAVNVLAKIFACLQAFISGENSVTNVNVYERHRRSPINSEVGIYKDSEASEKNSIGIEKIEPPDISPILRDPRVTSQLEKLRSTVTLVENILREGTKKSMRGKPMHFFKEMGDHRTAFLTGARAWKREALALQKDAPERAAVIIAKLTELKHMKDAHNLLRHAMGLFVIWLPKLGAAARNNDALYYYRGRFDNIERHLAQALLNAQQAAAEAASIYKQYPYAVRKRSSGMPAGQTTTTTYLEALSDFYSAALKHAQAALYNLREYCKRKRYGEEIRPEGFFANAAYQVSRIRADAQRLKALHSHKHVDSAVMPDWWVHFLELLPTYLDWSDGVSEDQHVA